MDIQNFIAEFKKTFVYDILSQTLSDEQLFEHVVDGDAVLWFKEQTRQMWLMWEKAKANAMPEGFVLVEKSKIRTWYQDDDEPENFCNSESDLNCLGDCLDDDDIVAVNIHESAHISTRKVFGVWKSNSPTDIQSNFVLVYSREKAEEIVASNKAMIEAQE